MNSTNSNSSSNSGKEDRQTKQAEEVINHINADIERSATTYDKPSFGWSSYAERVNGRFAMIGFLSILIVETITHGSFLKWAGILH